MTKRHASAVMRCQPPHKGHTDVIHRMTEDFDVVSVGLGSTGRHNEPSNPWTQADRQTMLRNVFGNRIRIIPLQDIGAEQTSNAWVDYVIQKATALSLPEITDYFTGSHADAMWYKGRFWMGDPNDPILDGVLHQQAYFTADGILRRLHIVDRSQNIFPSATEIRTYLATRSDEWKQWVPAVNHEFIEQTYPEEFKVKL